MFEKDKTVSKCYMDKDHYCLNCREFIKEYDLGTSFVRKTRKGDIYIYCHEDSKFVGSRFLVLNPREDLCKRQNYHRVPNERISGLQRSPNAQSAGHQRVPSERSSGSEDFDDILDEALCEECLHLFFREKKMIHLYFICPGNGGPLVENIIDMYRSGKSFCSFCEKSYDKDEDNDNIFTTTADDITSDIISSPPPLPFWGRNGDHLTVYTIDINEENELPDFMTDEMAMQLFDYGGNYDMDTTDKQKLTFSCCDMCWDTFHKPEKIKTDKQTKTDKQ